VTALLATPVFWAMAAAWAGLIVCGRAYLAAVNRLMAWIDASDPSLWQELLSQPSPYAALRARALSRLILVGGLEPDADPQLRALFSPPVALPMRRCFFSSSP
jgi:hypothetical protein